jgi:hypothetical protein
VGGWRRPPDDRAMIAKPPMPFCDSDSESGATGATTTIHARRTRVAA